MLLSTQTVVRRVPTPATRGLGFRSLLVYAIHMTRTNIDIDDEACTEVAPRLGNEGRRFLDHLAAANEQANPGLARLALKLATGAGKTTVMAMLIAWQTVNAVRRPGSRRFTRGFLVVTPGLTIRDRLRGSGYAGGTLFPWTVSDFSLMDAIESGIVKLHLFGQLKRITRQWLKAHLVCKGGTYPAQLMYQSLADTACERITRGVVARHLEERPVQAVLDAYNPVGSTRHVRFTTSKKTRWETDAGRCHVNWAIYDSGWEAEFCRVAEAHPRVRAYVKNHGLGLEAPSRYQAESSSGERSLSPVRPHRVFFCSASMSRRKRSLPRSGSRKRSGALVSSAAERCSRCPRKTCGARPEPCFDDAGDADEDQSGRPRSGRRRVLG